MPDRPDIDALKRRLLEIGGRDFQVDWFLDEELLQPEVELLLAAGDLDPADDLTLRPMDLSECHRNVRSLLAADGALGWRFGMALSSDEIWRVHSWALQGGQVIETTVPRIRYFGIDMGRLMKLRRHRRRDPDASDPYVRAALALGPPRRRLAASLAEGFRRIRRPRPPRD